MKRIAAALAALIAALAMMAAGPKIKFDTMAIDFGTLSTEDKPVELTYQFTNTGDAPLVIISAKASCGCTHPKYPDAPIPPGQSATITLRFNPRNQLGEVNKSVTIRTNAKKQKKLTLRLSGLVTSPH